MARLTTILEDLNKEILVALAPLVGADRRGRKAAVVSAVSARIHAAPQRLVEACGKAETLLLRQLAHGPASGIEPSRFTAKCGVPFPRIDRWGSHRPREVSVLTLVTEYDEPAYTLASDLRDVLKRLLPPLPKAVLRTVAELPKEHAFKLCGKAGRRPIRVFDGAAHTFEEGRRVLALIQQGKLRISTSSKRPSAGSVKNVASALLTPDLDLEIPDATVAAGPVRAHAWPVAAQQCGWARPQGTKLVLTRQGTAVLRSPSPDLWREGFQRLLSDRIFDELHRVPNIRGQTGRGKRTRTPTDERREAIAAAMAEWPVGEWIAFEEAYRFSIAAGHDFIVNRCPWTLYLCEHGYGCLDDGEHHDLARQYLRILLLETFATLGVVDLAYVPPHSLWPEFRDSWGADATPFCGRGDGLLYLRLTPLGAYCLGMTSEYQAPRMPSAPLRVLGNRDVVGIGQPELSPAAIAWLEIFAKRRSDAVWRLDETLIVAHLERGGTTDDVRDLLARHGVDSLPETVTSFLADIARRAAAVVGVEDALIVRFREPATAALIANDATGRKLCMAAGEASVAVPKRHEKSFRALLRRKGYPLSV